MSQPTQEGVMDQLLVALGQGTGTVQTSQEATASLRTRYWDRITPQVLEAWSTEANAVLVRIRTIGSLANQRRVAEGRATLNGTDVTLAADTVEHDSGTRFCQ